MKSEIKSEQIKKNFITIGGCHIVGYGIEGNPSFVENIETNLNYKCTFKKSHFQIKNVEKLIEIIENENTDIVVLQLGNFEFFTKIKPNHSSFSNSSSSSNNVVSALNHDFYEGKNVIYRIVLYFTKVIFTPFYWIYIKNKTKVPLLKLSEEIQKKPKKLFVIITPLPCYKSANNIIRKKSVSYFWKFFNLSNVVFVDSHKSIPIEKEMFFNEGHLGVKGHQKLGEDISEMISEYYKS